MKRPIRACVFDAYGTLFDVHSAIRAMAEQVGPHADDLSKLWRTKQLEYTWVRSLAGRHADFREITADALDFSMAFFNIKNNDLRNNLLSLYKSLAAFPEVPGALQALKSGGLKLAILSNGTADWLSVAIRAAGIAELLDAVWSVEEVGIFKPDPKVYRIATRGLAVDAAEIGFVSSNPWDAAGSAVNGFRAVWVNRNQAPVEYASMAAVPQIPDLAALAEHFVSGVGNGGRCRD